MRVEIKEVPLYTNIWTLHVYGREFLLGEEHHVIGNILDMTSYEIMHAIKTDDIKSANGNRKLAQLICRVLNITRSNVKSLHRTQFIL